MYFLQFYLISRGFNKETTFTCPYENGCGDLGEEIKARQQRDEYRLSIIFRAVQVFFGWVLLGMIINQIGLERILDRVDDWMEEIRAEHGPSQSLLDLRSKQKVTWKQVQESEHKSN